MTELTARERQRFWDEIFWNKVVKDEAGCWPWTGHIASHGYGIFHHDGSRIGAHRKAFELANGPIPDGINVCHKCDNPRCVRPDHLFLGTQKDNIADMIAKGRRTTITPQGEQVGGSKLKNHQVIEIRGSIGTHTEVARRYCVSRDTVRLIRAGRTWRHLP
jgi:hypothetical protein